MNRKMSKRQKDIKSKLMAAICMLLVSSIMMVSTTYAWFTLSTAPEVTGISTAVGANGNLEMALMPYSGNMNDIISAEGDSLKMPIERNVTWGNLVDVSHNASYGMDNIVLYPAQLNANADGIIGANPLATPKYGADGRVSTVTANTITGVFDPSKAQFAEGLTYGNSTYPNAKGVRAIGVASGMSARELAHRTALATAINEKSGANGDAGKILNKNGAAIGKIAMKHALDSSATHTQAEILPLKEAVAEMEAVVGRIEKSLKSYLLANSIAPETAENTYADLVSKINEATTLAAAEAVSGAVQPTSAGYAAAKTALATLKTNVGTAKSSLDGLGDTITWTQLTNALGVLVDMNDITVNDMSMADIDNDNYDTDAEGKPISGQSALISEVMGNNNTAIIVMPSGSGVFADIADFTGDYSASFKMPVSYGSIAFDANAEMYARAAGTAHLDSGNINAAGFTSASGNSAANPITTFYGYILDLAFRTNAANSNLLLQPEATDRIYTDGTNEETMGHGATMSFKTDSRTFGQAGVKALMENIRVVFFDPSDKGIIGYARLDSTKATNNGDYVVMPLMMTNASGAAITKTENGETVADNTIMALNQNEAAALSVMVYLDGTAMTNADVAADAAQSMFGSMNLQFSSSATLKPMEYSDLMAENNNSDAGDTTPVPMNNVKKPAGYTVMAFTNKAGNTIAFSLNGGTLANSIPVSVKIGTETYTATTGSMGSVSGYTVSGVTVTADTEIEIIVGENTQTTTYTVGLADSSAADIVLSDNAANATANTAYTFKLTNNGSATISKVEYSVGGTTKGELTVDEGGVYTIPAENVTGNILITVTAQ